MYLGIGEEKTVVIEFDPAYKEDEHIRLVEETLIISYKEHPHVVSIFSLNIFYSKEMDWAG